MILYTTVPLADTCFELDTSFDGNNLPDNPHTEADALKCQRKCFQTEGCKFFTFNTLAKLCWLKDKLSTTQYAAGGISGPASCSGYLFQHCILLSEVLSIT